MPRILYFAAIAAWTILLFTAGPLAQVQAQTPVHDPMRWHPPGFGHEHGAAPPPWVDYVFGLPNVTETFGGPLYAGDFSTSPAENTLKHAGMKGYLLDGHDLVGDPIQIYVILHTFSNPMDRSSQFHSFRAYILDTQGVSIIQRWVNYGDPSAGARVPAVCSLTGDARVVDYCKGYDAFQRPIVFVVDDVSRAGTLTGQKIQREQWYGSGFFSWAVGINATSRFVPGEQASDTDPHKWHTQDMGLGQVRQLELKSCRPGVGGCWFPPQLRGQAFYMTQFGEILSPSDPRCVPGSATHCLIQYVSPNYQGVDATGVETVYPLPPDGVVLPN